MFIVHLQYDFYKAKTGLIIGRGKIRIVPVWSKRNILCFKTQLQNPVEEDDKRNFILKAKNTAYFPYHATSNFSDLHPFLLPALHGNKHQLSSVRLRGGKKEERKE